MAIGFLLLLEQTHRFWWGLHILGVVFGLGAATVTDVMFLHFMRNFRIERREAEIMETLSKIIWVGLGLLVVSGLALMLPRWDFFVGSERFLMKMTAVAIVLINGLFLNFWLQPRARKISFIKPERELSQKEIDERSRLRRTAFVLGGVSVVSWYGAFALAVLTMLTLSYGELFLIFVGLMGVAVLGSQIKELNYREQVEEELGEEVLE